MWFLVQTGDGCCRQLGHSPVPHEALVLNACPPLLEFSFFSNLILFCKHLQRDESVRCRLSVYVDLNFGG